MTSSRAAATGDPTPFVSIVVPVLNGEATIRACLVSLLAGSYPRERREIVVVDNGSTDCTAEIVEGFPVRRVREGRRGLSHARNRGIEESRGEMIAFTDADCVVTVGWLAELVEGLRDPAVSCVAGEVVAYPPATPVERYTARRKPSFSQWTLPRRLPWIVFMNAAVRREVFDRVGLFDGRFTGVGSEDMDFSWRMLRAGIEPRLRPRALVFHCHRTTVRGLFRQQIGYGRGQAVLRDKYPDELPWGARQELAAWRDLGFSALRASRAWLRNDRQRSESAAFGYPGLDFVHKLGQRIGFVEQRLRLAVVKASRRGPDARADAPVASGAAHGGGTV